MTDEADEIEARANVPAAEWNRFLEAVPGSHHLQSTLWAELKAPLGWEPDRVALRRKGAIVAAIQVLHRRVIRKHDPSLLRVRAGSESDLPTFHEAFA